MNLTTGTCSRDFTAREDDGTGLYYYRARYYQPSLGRFVSEDPIEYAGGDANFYAYVSDDPIRSVDPGGLKKIYGNWCGPDWTGGRVEQYTPHAQGYYAAPIDALDAACQAHDICYYRCRKVFPCNPGNRGECFRLCDRTLTQRAYAIGGFWGRTIGAAIDRPGNRDPGPNDPSCCKNAK